MAANNGGRQGGGGGGGGMNEHVEFSVKAAEDLFLQGTETTIRRVTAETNYSCLMLKTQRFSSLFRHYAKYHGLRKEELEYYFVNLLENEDTPESVQLQRGDTIMVRRRRKAEPAEAAADDEEYFQDMKELLYDEAHADAIFVVQHSSHSSNNNNNNGSIKHHHPSHVSSGGSINSNRIQEEEEEEDDNVEDGMDVDGGKTNSSGNSKKPQPIQVRIPAHKSVLSARTDYFSKFFRNTSVSGGSTTASSNNSTGSKPKSKKGKTNGIGETDECIIQVEPIFNERHIRHVLEFIYTNRIADIHNIDLEDMLSILHLSDKWNLRDLKRLVEHALFRDHMRVETVARLYGATEMYNAKRLCKACTEFIMANLRQLAGNAVFEEEMKNFPHLCTLVLKAAADLIPDGPAHKKQRMSDLGGGGTPTSAVAAFRSSPVPDSDT